MPSGSTRLGGHSPPLNDRCGAHPFANRCKYDLPSSPSLRTSSSAFGRPRRLRLSLRCKLAVFHSFVGATNCEPPVCGLGVRSFQGRKVKPRWPRRERSSMSAFSKSLLLFALNWLDAQLTLLWVRGGVATEGNGLMAYLLHLGNFPFLLAKLSVGALVAFTLYRFSHLALARRGLHFTLGLYLTLM